MIKDHKFWKNKKVLITGHTGFKGSWLSLVLYFFGAKLYGYSLKPKKNFLFNKINLKKIFKKSIYSDILNSKNFNKKLKDINPEIIFHMAAQPLVVDSYKDPKKTFNINIIGTVNLFEAIRKVPSVRTVVIITTDKVYKIKKNNPFYDENHPLGASDPYGTSKSCVELISESYKYSFFKGRNISISTARAGNIIGGGDWSKYRLLPDIIRSCFENSELIIRNPNSVRPWQHVLDPILGYLDLGRNLSLKPEIFNGAWNFGPDQKDPISVNDIIEIVKTNGELINIKIENDKSNKEAKYLQLDITKSKTILNWTPKWDAENAIKNTLKWYRGFYNNISANNLINNDLELYLK